MIEFVIGVVVGFVLGILVAALTELTNIKGEGKNG